MERILYRRYVKILYVDFTADTFVNISAEAGESFVFGESGGIKTLSTEFSEFADGPLCADEDRARFKEFTNIKNIKKRLSMNPRKAMCFSYQRKRSEEDAKFGTFAMEIFPDIDENGHNVAYIFVKDMTAEIKSYVSSIEEKELQHAEKQNSNIRKVLIVEDNAISIAIADKIISEKYNTLLASNGEEALHVLESNEDVSLILIDLHMPVMDGFTFLREKKQNPSIASIPVIVTTSDAGAEEEIRCLSLGATDVILKPYNRDIMLSRVESVIRLHESSVALSAVERDDITGLYTRSAFFHYAEKMLSQNKDISYDITITDIAKFRHINQLYGTETGDTVLKIVADVLQKFLKNDKILIGRYGADQFAILGPTELLAEYAKRDNFFAEVDRKLKKSEVDKVVNIVFKRGIYSCVDKSIPVSEICDRAILALRTVEPEYGNSTAVFSESMNDELNHIRMIERSMQTALTKGQFKVYFQPKHNAQTGKLVGAEALIRWIHPEKGLMTPGMFIPIFEKNGFISKLDQFVIRSVCKNIKEWEQNGIKPVPVSINISRRDLLVKEDEGLLSEIIDEVGVEKKLINLEITESVYGAGEDWLIARIGRLRDQGFQIEMDDFGSGYSALNMIKAMPLDTIKLDMGFIKHLDEHVEVVKAMISLAHVLGKKVTAEGVETEEQLTTLRTLGCDTVQGYYYSKPLPLEEFTEYLKNN